MPDTYHEPKAAVSPRRFVKNAWAGAVVLLRGFSTCRRGNVTVEMAFGTIVLTLLAVGAYDFGRLTVEKARMESAAQAGLQYGVQDQSSANDSTRIIAAAREDAGDTGSELAVSSRRYCSCPVLGEVACSATCNDGAYSPMYVEITVQKDVDMLFNYPGIPSPLPVASSSRIRVR